MPKGSSWAAQGPGGDDHLCDVAPGTSTNPWLWQKLHRSQGASYSSLLSVQFPAGCKLGHFCFICRGGGKNLCFLNACMENIPLSLCSLGSACSLTSASRQGRGKCFISQPCELRLGRCVTKPAPGHGCCPQPHLVTLWHFSALFCCSQRRQPLLGAGNHPGAGSSSCSASHRLGKGQ